MCYNNNKNNDVTWRACSIKFSVVPYLFKHNQSNTRHSIPEIYGWMKLCASCYWIIWGWCNTRNEGSQLSKSVSFETMKGRQQQFQEKELSHKCLTLVLARFFCCCSCYCLSRNSLLENWSPGTLHFCLTKNICVWIHYNAWSSLMQEIQFLEFMGRFNLTHALSNYLIWMW